MFKFSEALESLFRIGHNHREDYINGKHKEDYSIIEQALLETQKTEEENKQLKEQLGCPLDVLAKLMLNGFYYEYPEYDDYDEPTGKTELIYDRFMGVTYLVRGTDKNIYIDTMYLDEPLKLSDYKKTWWLREDKSE